MKILFTNPPWWDGIGLKWKCIPMPRAGVRAGSRWPFTFHTTAFPGFASPLDYRPFPFFMAYAASYSEEKLQADVILRDSIGRRESYKSYFSFIEQNHFDIIIFEIGAPSADHDFTLIKKVSELQPSAKIIVAGPITAERSESMLRELPITACIKGEYEKGVCEVAHGRTGVIEHMLLSEDELNSAPLPKFDDKCGKLYFDINPKGIKRPHGQIWTNRGCPFKCIFCVWPAIMTNNDPHGNNPRKVRYYRPEYIEKLLKSIVPKYGLRSIYIDDDTFNLGDRHTIEVSNVMKKFDLPWSAMCRADTIKMETWNIMKDCGCYGVKIGIESGSQEVVDGIINKRLNLKKTAEVVKHLRNIDMSVHGTFTVGLPGETKQQMQQTINFAKSLPFTTVQISGTAEIEGTPLWHIIKTGAKLKNYKEAVKDDFYISENDGSKKADKMQKFLSKEG